MCLLVRIWWGQRWRSAQDQGWWDFGPQALSPCTLFVAPQQVWTGHEEVRILSPCKWRSYDDTKTCLDLRPRWGQDKKLRLTPPPDLRIVGLMPGCPLGEDREKY